MDFVNEEQRFLLIGRKSAFGFGQHIAELFHAIGNGTELAEDTPAGSGENVRESCFSRAGGTVKDDGTKSICGKQSAEQFSFAEKVFLSDEFVQRLRTHPYGKRFGFPTVFILFGGKKMGHVRHKIPFLGTL